MDAAAIKHINDVSAGLERLQKEYPGFEPVFVAMRLQLQSALLALREAQTKPAGQRFNRPRVKGTG